MFLKSKKVQKKKLKNKKQTSVEKQKIFPDVRMFYSMPLTFLLSLLCLALGFGGAIKSNHDFTIAKAKVSMTKGATLPLFRGDSKGTLTMGNSIISKDKKHLAVEITYDQDAHQQLSAFGNKYKLWLVTSKDYPIKNIQVKYGFFGTDGNGVLQVDSTKKLTNEAFVIMIVDEGKLLTSDDISSQSVVTSDDDINKSITAQLAEGNAMANSDDTTTESAGKKISPPIYYLRLNPYSSKKVKINWGDNEQILVNELFIKDNINTLKKQLNKQRKLKGKAEYTLQEWNKRLEENPDDATAQQEKQDIKNSLESISQEENQLQANYNRIKKARLKKNVLGTEQKNHKVLQTDNLGNLSGSGN